MDGDYNENEMNRNEFEESENKSVDSDFDYSFYEQGEENPKDGKKDGIIKKACGIVVSGVLIGGIAGGCFYGINYCLNNVGNNNAGKVSGGVTSGKKVSLTTSDIATSSDATTLVDGTGLNGVEKIADACLPSVVAITNLGVSDVETIWGTYKKQSESAGSGVIIGQTDEELIILTNYHVVSNSNELSCVFSFDESSDEPMAVQAYIKGYDSERDIAVVSIKMDDLNDDILDKIRIAVVGDSDDLRLGEQVVAIGNALGYGQSVTTGIVSALNRYVELEGTDGNTISNYYIQTDAAINPGNSGGALFTMNGELIGINSAKVSSDTVEGMGYAIPISDIQELVDKLMNLETRVALPEEDQGYLCIGGSDVDSTVAEMYSVPQGVYVNSVYKNLAADKAGIEEGDIIIEVDGSRTKSMDELKAVLSYIEGGETINITVMRFEDGGYKEKTYETTLSTYKEFNSISKKSTE